MRCLPMQIVNIGVGVLLYFSAELFDRLIVLAGL